MPRQPDDSEKTLSWVELMLEECGFNQFQAAHMAEAGVDWHKAKRLLDSGCDHETAVLLLMPDD